MRICTLETSKDKENEDYETQIEMEFFNMNQNNFEELKDELRNAFAKLLKVPKTSIQLALKKVLVKRGIIDDNLDEESTVLVLTVVTNTLELAKEIEKSLNMETFVQDLNNEIKESEILKQSGIALERVSASIDERVDGMLIFFINLKSEISYDKNRNSYMILIFMFHYFCRSREKTSCQKYQKFK